MTLHSRGSLRAAAARWLAGLCLAPAALWAQTPISSEILAPMASESAPATAVPRSFAGRLSVVIQTEPVQQMIADFELEGDAQQGELRLFGPFGSSIAVLQWEPGRAVLIEVGVVVGEPGQAQILHGFRRDLLQRTEALLVVGAADSKPFGWIGVRDARGSDAGRVAAVRAAAGPGIALRLDANGAWSVEEAVRSIAAPSKIPAAFAFCHRLAGTIL